MRPNERARSRASLTGAQWRKRRSKARRLARAGNLAPYLRSLVLRRKRLAEDSNARRHTLARASTRWRVVDMPGVALWHPLNLCMRAPGSSEDDDLRARSPPKWHDGAVYIDEAMTGRRFLAYVGRCLAPPLKEMAARPRSCFGVFSPAALPASPLTTVLVLAGPQLCRSIKRLVPSVSLCQSHEANIRGASRKLL